MENTRAKISKSRLAAIILYALLTSFLFVNSLLSQTASAKLSGSIASVVKPILSVFYKPVTAVSAQPLVITCSVESKSVPAGEEVVLGYNASADVNANEVEGVLSNPISATLTQTVVPTADGEILQASVLLTRNTALTAILQDKATKKSLSTITLTPKTVNYDYIRPRLSSGAPMESLTLVYDSDADYGWASSILVIGNENAYEPLRWSSSDESVFTVSVGGMAVAQGIGTATLTVTAELSGTTCSIPVTVRENTDYVTPVSLTVSNVPEVMYVGDVYRGSRDDWVRSPSNARVSGFGIKASDRTVVRYVADGSFTALKAGNCTFRVYAVEKPELFAEFTITVLEQLPENLRIQSITDKNKVGFGARVQLEAVADNDFSGDIIWSSATENLVTVNKKGVIVGRNIGKTTVRATYAPDPTIYADFEVRVNVGSNQSLYSFTRKILGHGGLFFSIGLLSVFVYAGVFKKEWQNILLRLGAGVASATISEVFQLPAFSEGRFASPVDALIDITAFTIGLFVTLAVCAIVRRRKNKARTPFVADGRPLILNNTNNG